MRIGKLATLGLALLLFFSVGCGTAAKKLVENATGCKNIGDKNEKCTVKTGNGNVSVGAGSSLPDGWPSAVPTPKHDTITGSSSSTSNGESTWSAVFSSKDPVADAIKAYTQQLKDKGFTITSQNSVGAGGFSESSVEANNKDYKVTALSVNLNLAGETSSLSVTVNKKTAQEKADDASSSSAAQSSSDAAKSSSDSSATDSSSTDSSSTDSSSSSS